MVPLFNDRDIIGEVLNHLICEGAEPVVLDNGSTDGSFEICQKLFKKGKIDLKQFKSKKFYLMEILRKLYDMALVKSPDWIIFNGSDEFLESGQKDLPLKKAISHVDFKGYNLIQFNVFNFFMTDDDQDSAKSVREKMTYYSFDHDNNYRAWKFHPGILPELRGGHLPIFPGDLKYRIWPRKFILRHYQFRNNEQAKKKIKERLERNEGTAETKTGWHTHYSRINLQRFFDPLEHTMLNKYHEDNRWNLERGFTFSNPHPKRKDIFLDDGSLKKSLPSYAELKLSNMMKQQKIENLQHKITKIENDKKV